MAAWERVLLYLGVGVGAVVVAVSGATGSPGFALLAAGALLFSVWYWVFATAHEGVMSNDGQLWFKNPLRQWRFHVGDVRRISVGRNEGTPVSFVIRTIDGKVRVGYRNGGPIVRSILAANAAVEFRGHERPPGAGAPAEAVEPGRPTRPPTPTSGERRA